MSEMEKDELVDSLASDFRSAQIAEADRQMLEYAEKLTNHPSEIVAADVDGLRRAGFEDRAIHDICTITAYFAFVNRIADGLGVKLENG